jgi:parallel beta-helix repeat protein
MKTLDQVEPRTPLNATTTPGNSGNEFIITQPGSYYLTGNVTTAKENGISIRASDVTLDLNGFEIRSTVRFTSENGVEINAARCTVKNGRISGWGYGVRNEPAEGREGTTLLQLTLSDNQIGVLIFTPAARIDGCTALNNFGNGITAGASALVRNCVSRGNSSGISVGVGSNVTHCTATENRVDGINGGSDVTIESCTTSGNRRGGIRVGPRSAVRNSTANRNGDPTGLRGPGIAGDIRALISGCTADENRHEGIVAQGDSVILNNRASFNGRGGAEAAAAGILITGSGSRVEGNHVRDTTGVGIKAGLGDVIIRNTAGNNSVANYDPASGNNFGPLQNPSTATNPMANVQF